MAFHEFVQRVLLVGVRLGPSESPPAIAVPDRLKPLLASLEGEHRKFDQQALHFGHRYRSSFWAIYLLSSIAVLCAVMPLALGWDTMGPAAHSFAVIFAVLEVVLIGTVGTLYWIGHRRDWQGTWLRARTRAELVWYLPMLAPLLDFGANSTEQNWYARLFSPGHHLQSADDVSTLCAKLEPQARTLLVGAWSDPAFVSSYASWAANVLEQQRQYHRRVAAKHHALMHRVHSINAVLFGLTALGATLHLFVHALWLSLITTFFPALGAGLHGALAQSESYRLAAISERLTVELASATAEIRAASSSATTIDKTVAIRSCVQSAVALIIEEHQDWNLLVRPHRLPLA